MVQARYKGSCVCPRMPPQRSPYGHPSCITWKSLRDLNSRPFPSEGNALVRAELRDLKTVAASISVTYRVSPGHDSRLLFRSLLTRCYHPPIIGVTGETLTHLNRVHSPAPRTLRHRPHSAQRLSSRHDLNLGGGTGLEPATTCSTGRRSTVELPFPQNKKPTETYIRWAVFLSVYSLFCYATPANRSPP